MTRPRAKADTKAKDRKNRSFDGVVSTPVLARWLDCSDKTVRELARRGVVVRAGRGLYVLEASVSRTIGDLRKTASARGGEDSLTRVREQRIRLAKAQADAMEIKNQTACGDLVEAAAVETEWSGVLRTVGAGMLAVPSRVGLRLPHLTAHDVAEIDAEVRAVLTEIGSDEGSMISVIS